MTLCKILKGDSSRIDFSITPFHDGYIYFTPNDGRLYIDSANGQEQKRVPVTSQVSSVVYGTLTASSWNNSRQSINVQNLAADQNGVIGIAQDITAQQLAACRAAGLYVCGQGIDTLTIAADGTVPSCDIPVVIILLD